MPDPYNEFYEAFLKDHPEELTGVKMVTSAGEPQLMMSSPTLGRFIVWALGMGLVGNVEKALEFLDEIPHLEERAKKDFAAQKAAPQYDHLILRERQT